MQLRSSVRTLQHVRIAHARPELIDARASAARGRRRNIDKCYCDTDAVLSATAAAAVGRNGKKRREGCTRPRRGGIGLVNLGDRVHRALRCWRWVTA